MMKAVSKNMFLAVIGGGYVVAIALMIMAVMAFIGGAAAAENQGQDSGAAQVAVASGMGMFMLALACMIVPVVAFFVLIYKAWAAIDDGQARTTPLAAVLLLLIPFFNWYWIFQAIWGWAQDYNKYNARHNVGGEAMSEGLFIAYAICCLVFLPGALVLMFVVVAKMCDGINAIAAAPPQAMAATAR